MALDKDHGHRRVLELIAADSHGVGSNLAREFGVSLNGYLQALTQDGSVEAEGSTRARTYRSAMLADTTSTFARDRLEEDRRAVTRNRA